MSGTLPRGELSHPPSKSTEALSLAPPEAKGHSTHPSAKVKAHPTPIWQMRWRLTGPGDLEKLPAHLLGHCLSYTHCYPTFTCGRHPHPVTEDCLTQPCLGWLFQVAAGLATPTTELQLLRSSGLLQGSLRVSGTSLSLCSSPL